uniref:Chitin-binding type-2 domain-containing protein n=1 Tax=Caenorhabditis japonica TaxID=281687 RepID=A0A8R1EKN4_CAEJA
MDPSSEAVFMNVYRMVEAITAAEEPVPECTEGVFVIEPCSQHYKKCVNGKEAVFTCESGLFFSEQQAGCTPAHIIPECQIKIAQPY